MVLVFGVVLVLFIINQGVGSLVGQMFVPIKRTLLFIGVIVAALFAASTQGGWGADPVGGVEVFPDDATGNSSSLSGTVTNSGAANGTDSNHGADAGHGHDD